MIHLEDDALAMAAHELGTTTKTDAVSSALTFVTGRRQQVDRTRHDDAAFGVGQAIGNPEVMRQARR